MPGCTSTFRDDKLEGYISHYTKWHGIDGQQTIDQGRLKEYFNMKKREHRNNIRPDLCTIRNPKSATTFLDASGNWHLNPGEDDTSPSSLTQGDNVASYGLGQKHPSHATGSSLSGRVSELKQELSHKCQYIDYLKNSVLKAERDKEGLERKIKLLE
ncbi:uncharacterized protein Z519_03717 [Cladophialophora bantiana CBS 173.52]|uniref:Uncharacterized protein n=1 Tax=Cladophialophora bantiana (strain ATCC 10958 / CBS 173.52 / CDC B-1940 / NIH 8579) TaxID=1442370 RepID=A0A0D2HP07_CLAB1|nr:uncharacterized protein Z519_03717 [Cladophialophora bantiana CBS 173.52]KIW95133.1 hypothetical protein Z519_03717 [Cladophialophora bantiana CBS 173.52]